MSDPLSPDHAAECALAFEQRLKALPAEVDSSWRASFVQRAPALTLLDEARQQTALQGLLQRFCGPPPGLERLAAGPAQLALRSRPMVLRALGLLALARRAGALRCCVAREQKEALEQLLGDSLEAVEAIGESGRPVGSEVTGWTPMHWSCLGYLDWLKLVARDDGFLRRVVRVMLPRGLLGMPQRVNMAPPDLAPAEAVARLGAAGVHWPC